MERTLFHISPNFCSFAVALKLLEKPFLLISSNPFVISTRLILQTQGTRKCAGLMHSRHLVAKRKYCMLMHNQSSCLFSTILFMPWLQEHKAAKSWGWLLKSVSRTPLPFSFMKLSSIPPHSRTPLVSLLLHHAASGGHFWMLPFSVLNHSCCIHFFPLQLLRSAYLTTNLYWVVQKKREHFYLQLDLPI